MKILLANPPAYLYDHNRHFIQAGSRWSFSMDAPKGNHAFPHYQPYPFSLGYASSLLKRQILKGENVEVEAFDGCAMDQDEAEFINTLKNLEPDLLVLEVPTVSYPLVLRMLKEIDREVGCRISLAGPHVTAFPDIREDSLLRGDWPAHYADGAGFDLYPPPDRVNFPNTQYSNFEFRRPSAQMLTSKGCVMPCSFCLERHVVYNSPVVELRGAENVVAEMEQLKAEGARQIHFDDMDITVKPEHVRGLCEAMLHRKLGMPWTCLADMLTAENMLPLMAMAGCIGLAFGVETVTPGANAGKAFITRKRAVNFVKECREHGIHAHATVMIGLPGETRESILENIHFVTGDLDTDSVQFSIATPFPGTPFYQQCVGNDWLITDDWTRYDGARSCVVDYPHLKHTEIEELFQYAMQMRKEKKLGFRDVVHPK